MITIRPSKERAEAIMAGSIPTTLSPSINIMIRGIWDIRSLRVINEDVVAPGNGFPTHPHRDMEIITYVFEGALEHKDSLGTGSVIRPGDGQRMSAGRGIRHSEANPSQTDPVHLLQIWIMPSKAGIEPSYEQKAFPEAEKRGKLRVIASADGREDR